MPIGLTLDLNDSNINYNNSNYNSNGNNIKINKSTKEIRMIKNQYISPYFKESSSDIIQWLSTVTKREQIGEGTHSKGYIITLASQKQYIVRETEVISPLIKNKLSHEISIYKTIQEYPESSQYVSKLLYADIPLVYHKNSKMNNAYFIFEYVPGTTLESLIQDTRIKVPFSTIMEWITYLTKAIDFLDRINIIHRDIKPQNIYIDTLNNRPLLFDLETACIKGKDCITYEFRGTREYAPPKALQLLGQTDFSNLKSYEHTKYSDYYSVIKIMEKDFSRIIVPEQRDKLLDYVKLIETEILKRSGGGTRKSRKLKQCHKNKKSRKSKRR